jgi:hypothetical protein
MKSQFKIGDVVIHQGVPETGARRGEEFTISSDLILQSIVNVGEGLNAQYVHHLGVKEEYNGSIWNVGAKPEWLKLKQEPCGLSFHELISELKNTQSSLQGSLRHSVEAV